MKTQIRKWIAVFTLIFIGPFVVLGEDPGLQFALRIDPGVRRVVIADENWNSVVEPHVEMDKVKFSYLNQETTGILGTAYEAILVRNPTPDETFTVEIAPTNGPEALWSDMEMSPDDDECLGTCMDFNSGTGIGQLTIDPTTATIIREDGKVMDVGEGIEWGEKKSFVQGSVDSMVLFLATAGADYRAYRFMGAELRQTIPARQLPRTYFLSMTLTVS